MPGLKKKRGVEGGRSPPAGGVGGGRSPPHLQMVVILVGILIYSNSVLAEEEVIVEAEEGVVIRTWVEPGFEPVIIIIIILIVVIAIIVIIKMIML